jgi:hypothetical protein
VTGWPTVALTGHRPQHLSAPARDWVRTELDRLAIKLRDDCGMTVGISGMAAGSDLWWADSLIKAGVTLWPHVPFMDQPARWPVADRVEWLRLLNEAGRAPVVYGDRADVRHLFARNEGMVDAVAGSGMLLAVWVRGKRGGTCEALRYALGRGMRPTWVDPVQRRTWWPTPAEWARVLPARRRVAA